VLWLLDELHGRPLESGSCPKYSIHKNMEKPKNPAKEMADMEKEATPMLEKLNAMNRKRVRHGALPFTLAKTKPYVLVPDDVEGANARVLADNKNLNMNGWVRAVMIETKGVHSEAELKEFLQTLIDDEVVESTPGKGREKILTLA